jgi:signal peptidase II
MKIKRLFLLVALVVMADQALKFYIKTNFHLHSSVKVMGEWFQLYFVENPGMAYGWKFGGGWGKIALTVFRMGAVLFGSWYLLRIIKLGYNKWFIVCAGLIYAGALGNLIDSTLYGMIFDRGMVFEPSTGEYLTYGGLATISSEGYSSFLHGNVVDMFYFPIIRGQFPDWMPFWGGEDFEFFRPIFNLADAAISTGVMGIVFFQKFMFKQQSTNESAPVTDAV